MICIIASHFARHNEQYLLCVKHINN